MSMFSIEDLEKELEDRKAAEANKRRTPWYRFVAEVLIAAAVLTIVLVKQAQIREYYFPTPVVITTNDLSLDDVNNEEEIIAEIEAKYPWMWVVRVHRMWDGSIWITASIHPDSLEYALGLTYEEWDAVAGEAYGDLVERFAPASRNGVIYLGLLSQSMRPVSMALLVTCMTNGKSWYCGAEVLNPPLPVQESWIEYEDRLIELPIQ